MAKVGRGSEQAMIRLPEGMRDELKKAAESNGRSMNAEIVTRLEESFLDPLVIPSFLAKRIERKATANGTSLRNEVWTTLKNAYPEGMSLGEFIEVWVLPISLEKSKDRREEMLHRASVESAYTHRLLDIREERSPDGGRQIVVSSQDPHEQTYRKLFTIPVVED